MKLFFRRNIFEKNFRAEKLKGRERIVFEAFRLEEKSDQKF